MRLHARIAAIEFAGDEVRLAVVKTGSKMPTLVERHMSRATSTGETTDLEGLVQAVQEVIGRMQSHPHAFVLCADSGNGVVRTLRVPFRGRRRVRAAVEYELEPYLAFPIEELVVDHCPIREVEGQTEVLTVGMQKTLLERQLGILHEAGIEAEGVGIDAAGLTALWLCGSAPKGLHAVLHVLQTGSIVAVLSNTTLAFFRHLPIGAEELRTQPGAAAREVANSIRAFLASWRSGEELAGLTVTGLTLDGEEREVFESAISVPVSYHRLMKNVRQFGPNGLKRRKKTLGLPRSSPGDVEKVEEDAGASGTVFEEDGNRWEALIGVAVGAAGGTVSFNFRRGALGPVRPWRGFVLHGVFTACLGALLLASYGIFCYVDYRHNMAEINRIGVEIWEMYAKAFPHSSKVQAGRPPGDADGFLTFELMAQEYKDYAAAGRGFDMTLLARPNLLDLLLELSELLSPDQVLLTELSVRPTRKNTLDITLMGELVGQDQAVFAQQLQKLKQSDLFQLTAEPVIASKQGKITFTVTASTG